MINAGCENCTQWTSDPVTMRAYGKEGWGICRNAMGDGAGGAEVVVSATGSGIPALLTHPEFGCTSFHPDEDTIRRHRASTN